MKWSGLVAFLIWELALSNIRVALAVIRPNRTLRPGIIAVPLDVSSDAQITILAILITLTPGTLALDLSDDRRTLYVHCLDVGNPQQTKKQLKQQFERKVREATE